MFSYSTHQTLHPVCIFLKLKSSDFSEDNKSLCIFYDDIIGFFYMYVKSKRSEKLLIVIFSSDSGILKLLYSLDKQADGSINVIGWIAHVTFPSNKDCTGDVIKVRILVPGLKFLPASVYLY